jgi:enoyl-[acyl-carrier protein] reductase II
MPNPICRALGIRYPILLGGLLNIGKAPLVAAVSAAGGLGILGAGAWDGNELRDQIHQVRERTDRPFGVNVVVRSAYSEEHVRIVIDERLPVVTTSAGDPMRYTATLKDNGVYVMHVVPTVAYALRAERAGVDAIVAEGSESGGFTSLEEISTFVLVPQVVDAVRCPVLAAGGIGDGRGLAAALMLGAVGVQVGTRFLGSVECGIPAAYKESLLTAQDTDTILTRSPRAAHRDLKKDLVARVLAHEREERSEEGLPKSGKALPVWSAGQVAGLVREILPAKELIERMVREAREGISAFSGMPEWLSG